MSNDPFITEDFLLETDQARRLYHDIARDLPIVDYHSHLPPEQIATDHQFPNMAQIWLDEDHYKWRALRADGVEERFITGDASDWEKFERFARTVPHLLRNPIYHWTHLELKRPFGISDRLLGPDTARGIWEDCNAMLAQPEFSVRGIMNRMNVELVCTTDDPVDSLEHHRAIAEDPSFAIQVLPTWRPEEAMAIENPATYNGYLDRLAEVADIEIRDFASLMEALRKRHAFFHEMGCRMSDRSLETIYAEDYTTETIETIFAKARAGKTPAADEVVTFKSAMLHELALMDHASGWTQALHIGPIRNLNTRMFKQTGPHAGFDSMSDLELARPLRRFLDRLDSTDQLAPTILYNMNPCHNAVVVTMAGNFQDASRPGKMQWGGAWWYLDQKDGIERQLEMLSQMSLLSRFVGMLTDSRSFLSFTRHEYFRRILCNMLGNDMARGLVPDDFELVGAMVGDICYNNAANYFGFDLKPNQ